MRLSVLIPTYGRSEKLMRCLAGLARQTLDGSRYEVIVGFDGGDAAAERAARELWNGAGCCAGLELMSCPREGYQRVRRRMLERARGELLVSLNDDIRPVPEFLEAHARGHEERRRAGKGPAIVVGYSPYVTREGETLLDRLARKTSLVFFYDAMEAAADDAERDWGFRHCFGLNFSAELGCVREAGGFHAGDGLYGYEDIELGYRLAQRFNAPVLFRPRALAGHEHYYEASDLIERERKLGRSAWEFARSNPGFGRACFGRDICSEDEIAYSREFVAREKAGADRARESFLALSQMPASCVDGAQEMNLLHLIRDQFLLLKRWTWRLGLLEGAAGAESAGAEARKPARAA